LAKNFLITGYVQVRSIIFIAKYVTTIFFIAYAAFWWKSMGFYCSVIPWNCTWYCTVQVLYFFHCSIMSWGLD